LLGRTEFNAIENPDSLEFSVVRKDGWLETVLVFKTELRLSAIEINSLRFDRGGEGDESGLYAKLDWGRILILPGVRQQQAEEIRDKIAARLPHFPVGDKLEKDRGLIILGLSKPGSQDSKPQS